jgi:hypothetical protein
MKTKFTYPLLMLLSIMCMLYSCQKDASSTSKTKTSTTLSTGSIAIASLASSSTSASSTDSVYLVNCFSHRSTKDSVAASALPAAITTYLTTNYSGYTFTKGFKIVDSTSVITNYIVVIKYNGNYIGLKFTAAGVFVSILEQREGIDMRGQGPGWHEGGPFDNRDGKHRDTIALSAIPSVVKTFFTTTYPKDTLLHAGVTPDSTYVLISKDSVLYATNITSAGKLIKRIKLEQHGGKHAAIIAANLPVAITTYLTATYPAYVFEKAFVETASSVVKGYTVFITSNNTRYAVSFDAAGTFVSARAIH